MHKVAAKVFGVDSVSPVSLMEKWYHQDNNMFHVINRESVSKETGKSFKEIVGYFSIMRITEEGLSKLRTKECTGATLPLTDINPKSKIIYIGAIVGDTKYSKGICMSSFIAYLKSKVEEKKIRLIVARPVTEDGLRLIEKFNFIKDKGDNDLYYIEIPMHLNKSHF